MALAIDVFQYPVAGVSSGSSNYAVLVMDDGTTGFLKKNATPAPTFSYATNSQFIDDPLTPAFESYTFGELLAGAGKLESFYVTSGKRESYVGAPIPASSLGQTTRFVNIATPPSTTPPIDVGTSDGIVPGTFRASASIVDKDGKSASIRLLASKPGALWNLSIEKVSGDGAIPTQGDINELTGTVVLDGWSDPPQSVNLRPIDWAVYTGGTTDPKPLSFTLFPGQTVPQRFLADLSRNESTISINSPLLATEGNAGDPGFFSGAGNVVGQVGQVVLDASTVVTNANVSSSNLFTVGVPIGVNLIPTRVPVDSISINRPIAAPKQQLIIEGAVGAPGQLLVGESGALANSLATPSDNPIGLLDIQAIHADVVFAGIVNATQQTYLMQSPLDPRGYTLTTVSPTSGIQTGRILGDTVGITLANDAGGEMNVRTTIDNLRLTTASTPSEPALPYAISILESNDLTVDAVPASRRPITIDAAGSLTTLSAVLTSGDVTLAATTALTMAGAVSSSAGNVVLRSNEITATVPITAGGVRGVSLQSRDAAGDVVANGLVRAGGQAKAPVRAATSADVDLKTGGLLVIDGVTLAAGDRVLVKNQTNPAENGIYVAATGPWSRAADANTSQLFVVGFTVAVREGAQEGAWTFANPVVPTLDQTGLAFVPASAVQTYVPALAATTGNVDIGVGGLLTIDGVVLAAGDRVLVKNQSNPRQNGLYIADPGAWVRTADADTVTELVAGSYVFVTDGVTNGQQGFVLADDAIQVGNTPLTFSPFTVQATRTNTYSPARILASVVAATTVNIDLAAPPAEIDGVTLTTGNLVLVKNQVDAAANGIYAYAPGTLTRWSGADSSSELPRGSMVFVDQGTTNAGSSWTFNDAIDFLSRTTAGSLQVSGLPSTLYLASGMLVTGAGIPSDTRIDLVINSTTVRLTKSALVTSSTAVLNFMQTSAVAVGTTPIAFVPTGGTAAITAGRSITSNTTSPSSRITASSAVLTAGRPVNGTTDASSIMNVNSAVGRITAIAPSSIKVSDSGAIDLFDVRSLTGGGVTIDAKGTITARSVTAAGDSTKPADIALSSFYGDVVAATVTSAVGVIELTSINGRVVVHKLGLNDAAVVSQNGDVLLTADVGGIRLEGDVRANGNLAGDITLTTNQGGLSMFAPTKLQAENQLVIVTPNSGVSAAAGVQVTGSSLSITSQFGSTQAPPIALAAFPTVEINRTDAGDIDYTSLVNLDVTAATTVAGSISFTAPSLKISGEIATAGANTDLRLDATTTNLQIDKPITSQRDVFLSAASGSVTSSNATPTALITAPGTLVVVAANSAKLLTKAQALTASLSGLGSTLEVQDDDGLMIPSAVLAGGGIATFKVGTSALGGHTLIGLIDAGPTGTVTIDSYGDIAENTADPTTDVVAQSATFKSANGRIELDTTVDVITASTLQKIGPITLRDLGTGSTPLQLASVAGTGAAADITVTSARTIEANSVATAGKVSLATSSAAASIQVGTVTATGNTATISAGGSIGKLSPAALITATSVVLDSTSGAILAGLAASDVAAATGAGGAITLDDADSLSIGNNVLSRGISTTGLVTITVGGALTQSQSVVGQTLMATSKGGAITLTNPNNDVDSLTVENGDRAVSFTDMDGLNVTKIVGGSITLVVGGNLSQTGSITGKALAITGTGGAVSLTNSANSVDTLSVINGTRNVTYTDKDTLTIAGAGVTGGNVVVTAGTGLTVSAPVTAGTAVGGDGDISLTSSASNISLAANLNAKADRVTLNASNGTITQTAGIIDSTTLVWYAKSAPTLPNANTFTVVGPHLTGDGNIRIPASGSAPGTLTVAGASTFNGNITIDADAVVITDLVQAGGTAKSVAITARAPGGITFQSTGRIETNAGATALSAANGGITATNTGTQTTVIGSSLSLAAKNSSTLTSAVDSFSGTVSAGNLTLTESTGLALGAVSAQAITLAVGGNLTQTGALAGTSLAITASTGTVTLNAVGNDVNSLTVSNSTRDVTFTDKDDLAINGDGITGGNVAVTAGSALTVSSPVTAGTAAKGDGNISLVSTAGSISLAANLIAAADRVTLNASNGTISQAAGSSIDSGALIWFAQSSPDPNPLSGNYTTVGPNLTAAGKLIIGPYNYPITIAGATTVNGDIVINAPRVVITDTVKTAAGNAVSVTATDGDIEFDGQLGGIVTAPAGAITLTATSGAVTAVNQSGRTTVRGGPLAVNAQSADFKCNVQSLTSNVTGGGLTVSAVDFLTLGPINAVGQTVTLSAASGVAQQSGSVVTAQTLAVTNTAGSVALTSSGNDVGSLLVSNPIGPVSFADVNELVIDTIVAGPVTLAVGTPIVSGPSLSQTASGSITATSLDITAAARGVQLTNAANDVGTLTVSNPGRVVSFTDKNELVVGGITGSTITLDVGAPLTQTGPIVGTSLSVTSRNRGIQLINPNNDVASLFVRNPGRVVNFTDKNSLSVSGITGGIIGLVVGNNLTQSSPIVGSSLTVTASAGSVTLTNGGNNVPAATITNGIRPVSFTNVGALVIGGLSMGAGTLVVGGNLSQSGPINGTSLGITSTAGTIDLRNPANNLGSLAVNNGSRLFSYSDISSIAITSAGTLSVGTVTAAQQMTVTTTNGGGVDVGPQASGLLQASGTLDLRAVQGSISIRNNGRIVGNPILLPPGKGIQVGGTITTPAELNSAIATINLLTPIPGSTYEILVAASMTLTQQLAVSRPVTFRGTSQSIVLSGSSTVVNGLLLDSGASGSTIRDIAFRSFSGDAIRLTSATGITIKGIQASNSGNGLSITGASTNTVVQGNTFDRNQTGVSLVSATGALIGGAATGQGNVISNAVRQGVFASGFCTGSQVVKNSFPGTATPYNVSASRNLTIVD